MTTFDVIVVGAGPAGSVAAADLAARGYRTALLDRARFPRDKPCGDYCNPGAVRQLEGLGVLPDLVRQGAALISGMTIVAQDGSTFVALYPTGRAMLVPRRRLDAVLAARAAAQGAQFVEGYQVDQVGLERAVTVGGLGRAPSLRAQLLLAADGMRSIVAGRLGLRTALPAGRYTIGAYFSGVPGPAAGELHLGPGLYGGVARFGDGTANVCLALPRTRMRRKQADAAFRDAVRTLPILREQVGAWTRESPYRVTGPLGFASHPVVAERTLLAGDAALQIEPITGQGMFFALRTAGMAAQEAASALEHGRTDARSLAGYARRRAQILGGRLRLLKAVTALALHPRMAPGLVRRLRGDARLAQTLLGATGDVLPPEAVYALPYLVRLLVAHAHEA
jgi:flavin-dependent dehydrogenase